MTPFSWMYLPPSFLLPIILPYFPALCPCLFHMQLSLIFKAKKESYLVQFKLAERKEQPFFYICFAIETMSEKVSGWVPPKKFIGTQSKFYGEINVALIWYNNITLIQYDRKISKWAESFLLGRMEMFKSRFKGQQVFLSRSVEN